MSLMLHVGPVCYREVPVDEVSALLGGVKAFKWEGEGARGLVVTKMSGPPAVCTCLVTICRHVADVRGFEGEGQAWDVPKVPA